MRRDYISGIYNACDYWCDRCAFTRRCRNFAMGEELEDVVSWYHTLLVPKTHRLISGLLKLPGQTAWNDGSDVFGTGKLLLVSIDRSLSAWSQLLAAFPAQEDAILGFLVRLDHLRRGIERAAPQARAFVRPGLDEPSA